MKESESLSDLTLRLGREHSIRQRGPLWSAPYDQDTAEAGFRFLTECWWTDNDTDRQIELIPKKEYVERFVHEWHGCYGRRQPLIVEKSRRIVISWICRGLETWQMGLSRGSSLIIDQTHANSAEHLWRIHFSLTQLYERRPELRLARHQHRGSPDIKEVTHVILANGSVMGQSYQEAGASQGKGKTIVTLEEISKYRYPSAFWGQAILVTQGSATGAGGWVCGVANASTNTDWQLIKGNVDARELLNLT